MALRYCLTVFWIILQRESPVKSLWAKSNIYLLTLVGISVAVYMALTWDTMLMGQRALGFFAVAIVLHEWEEMRFPGGFYELMTKKFGIGDYTQE